MIRFRLMAMLPLVGASIAWLAPASPARGQVVGETVTYPSGSKRVTVNIFAPDFPGKFPAVILLHPSGGLGQATGDVFREVAMTFASRGYVAFIPHYFEKTDHAIGRPLRQGENEAWLEAVNDVMAFAAARPEVDPTRFAMFGYSMGSGLAKSQAVRDPRIKAVASVSGAYPPVKPNKKLPPLLILHGAKDQGTPLKYVEQYVAGLKEQEMPHAVHVYKGMGHNFDLTRFGDATDRSVAFFDRHVKSSATRR